MAIVPTVVPYNAKGYSALAFTYGMLGGIGVFTSVGAGMLVLAPMFLSRAVAYQNQQIFGLSASGAF
jgi:hypothetical protein